MINGFSPVSRRFRLIVVSLLHLGGFLERYRDTTEEVGVVGQDVTDPRLVTSPSMRRFFYYGMGSKSSILLGTGSSLSLHFKFL